MKSRYVVIVAVLAGVAGVLASLAADPGRLAGTRLGQTIAQSGRGRSTASVGDRIPALQLKTPTGVQRDLSTVVGGHPVLINLWASWCAPCVREMPALDAFARAQGASGVQVVGIALDDAAAVHAFLRARPVSYAVFLDTPGPTDAGARLGDTRGVLPYSVLVGADGRILRQHVGPLEPGDLRDWAAQAARTAD